MTRSPIVAGRFYPAESDKCSAEAKNLLKSAKIANLDGKQAYGGLAPHAGWICSGQLAAMTLKALYSGPADPAISDTCVIFGAAHSPTSAVAAIYDNPQWQTPLGDMQIDTSLAAEIISACDGAVSSPASHSREHSIEVLLPILQQLRPNCKILPIMVPPSKYAADFGQQVAAIVKKSTMLDARIVYLASTDLTHYGPNYSITPAGTGDSGLNWANENDQRLLKIISQMDSDAVVEECSSRHNACGGGAIAACMAACRAAGATEANVLAHTNSYEVLKQYYPNDKSNSVGYCSVIFS